MYSIIAQSPGRINIIGEHTDYNEGFVLPAAIDMKTIFKLRKNDTASQINISSTTYQERHQFDLLKFEPLPNGWQNYVMGVVAELQKLGAKLSGFDGEFTGDIPIGAGLSSSAALECCLAYGLNELFSLGLDKWQLIKASQLAEHNFVGMQCGIMDQFASMMGKENHAMLLDCHSLEYEYYPLDLQDYEFVLLNSHVSHSLADSAYNKRRQECQEGVAIFQKYFPSIQSLRDLTLQQLDQHKDALPNLVYNRCLHVLSENQRVQDAVQSLLQQDFERLGNLMYASHFSLKDQYEVSCQEIDFLVTQTQNMENVLGSRMMGGGFGGCTLNLVKKASTDAFIKKTYQAYKRQFNLQLTPYKVNISNGSSLIKQST